MNRASSMIVAGVSPAPGSVTTPMVPYLSQGSHPPVGQSSRTCMVIRAKSPLTGKDDSIDTSR
ncbi:unannotated protein [freshwater metagenome]|uniref:Unannotated protein n=1 Tax=freshwater metagenome TaxID=449393 RepID=A0A6J7EUF2_9ZZZZ